MSQKKIFLVLENAMVFSGKPFGFLPVHAGDLSNTGILKKGVGEAVFNTGMSGYHEILTDSSYTGQLVVMTYPHIGNYGADDSWSEAGPQSNPEGVKPAGLIIRSLYEGEVPGERSTLDRFLLENSTPGITDVDTRGLTLTLRDSGSMRGIIVRGNREDLLLEEEVALCVNYLSTFPEMSGRDLVSDVGTEVNVTLPLKGSFYHIVIVDCGIKANIIRSLKNLGCSITIVPSNFKAAEILKLNPDGVVISNGPGDPAALKSIVEELRNLIGKVPVFGICLGHQLIALALGGQTFKLKFGHHGVNHPVRDERTKRVYITSQNHGFTVDPSHLPVDTDVWFTNANDGTVEGLVHKKYAVKSVQFHPEACPGPDDTRWIFKAFLESIPPK